MTIYYKRPKPLACRLNTPEEVDGMYKFKRTKDLLVLKIPNMALLVMRDYTTRLFFLAQHIERDYFFRTILPQRFPEVSLEVFEKWDSLYLMLYSRASKI